MALVLNLKCVENLRGKADRIAKVTFRGHAYSSRIVHSAKKVAYFGETFEWPVARPVEGHEFLLIEIDNFSKYLTNKPVGTFALSLQQLITIGQLDIAETLTDSNNRVIEEVITFEAKYFSPDGKVGDWENKEFEYPLIEDNRPKAEQEEGAWPPLQELGDDDLLGNAKPMDDGLLPGEDSVSQTMMVKQMYEVKKKRPELIEQELHRPRDFQICITIIEGMQLAGLDIDPVIRLEIGAFKKYTTIKQSTNNPFFNEYFVFDFFESPAMIFDKMITITALHSMKIPGRQVFRAGNLLAGRVIGQFKCDVGTVYAAPDHNYYHKWAVLIDPKDTSEGAKGYIKCDISVLGRGDVLRLQKHSSKEDDSHNIDGNLLLPKGVPMDRQRAIYQVIIFRGEDLPRTDLGIMASVRKAIGGTNVAFIDAFIKVSFAGHVGKTSEKKNYNPEWREILTFMDLFPPLCNRIKIQLCDSDVATDEAIGTHFIELSQIMDPGSDAEGILPTYGPNWINFYGAPRNYKILGEQHDDLNEGLGEGAAYRGRALMALKTEIVDSELAGPTTVIREKLRTSTRTDVAPRREFLLFATFFEATMIDKELNAKPITFELSVGQFGNILDAKSSKSIMSEDDGEESEDEGIEEEAQAKLLKKKKEEELNLPCQSCTPAEAALPMDKNYCFIPFNDSKPCTYVVGVFEDLRKRLYHINLVESVLVPFEDGLEDVRQMMKDDHDNVHRRLRGVLGEFISGVDKYIKLAGSLGIGSGSGKTKLDKYRQKMCRNSMEKFRGQAESLKSKTSKDSVREKFREAKEISRKVKQLSKEPQQSIPDVFIWMLSEKKRIAYFRIAANDLMDATDDNLKGKYCGKLQTLFLKKPGKMHQGSAGWVMQAKLEVFLWLGMRDDRRASKAYLENMPQGYDLTHEMKMSPLPPPVLIYPEHHIFQLRAYLFQARCLLGSDDTGLSDPFARVLVSNQCQQTQVIDKSLSPTWDETLVFSNIVLYGPIDEIVACPPLVIIEVFDYDTLGKPEFLGRAMVKPKVKPGDVDYDLPEFPPQLQWWDVHRGPRQAGEILASFELLQNRDNSAQDYSIPLPPAKVLSKSGDKEIIPLPRAIKPTLSRFRLEAILWGVRELKKIQLSSIDNPRVELECAGNILRSKRIEDMMKNSNFEDPVTYMDVDLPDNKNFWPPITIRVLDCRKFGREVLVGIHSINHILKYLWVSQEEEQKRINEEEENKRQTELERQQILAEYNQAQPPDITEKRYSKGNVSSPGSVIINIGDIAVDTSKQARKKSLSSNINNNNSGSNSITNIPAVNYQQPGVIDTSGDINKHTAITMPVAVPEQNATSVQVGADGQPLPPGTIPGGVPQTIPPGQIDPNDPAALEKAKIKKKKKKDLIADLDWWSKYYVTKEDFDKKKQKEMKERMKYEVTCDSSDEELLADADFRDQFPEMLDYSSLDAEHIKELQELAADKRKQEESDQEKDKKKKKKSKSKAAKSKLKKLKGVLNEAFEHDTDPDDLVESEIVQEDDMDDKSHILRIEFYDCELENTKTFGGFTDHFETFELFRGKKLDDEDDDLDRVSGIFKGNICIYKIDKPADPETQSLVSVSKKKTNVKPQAELKLYQGLPSFKPHEVQVFVYIVKATDLHPTDLNGKSDPYLILKCGRREINDKANKQNNQLNPVYGKMYEFDVCFPMDSILHIQVMDYDLLSADDLIGETTIDLENRFFSKHRGTCGLSNSYDMYGYNIWRDTQKPSQILEKLCKQFKIDQPKYRSSSVVICGKTFYGEENVELESGEMLPSTEHLALAALKHWDELPGGCELLPDHLETRILQNPERPGVEQGRLEMWIDMYPKDLPAPTITVDITPRQPKEYELRVIIWNTDDVVLEDTNFVTGEQSSDIFVRGYLIGKGEDDQQTDVHYRSLTGEGNFNWRLIYPFNYLKAEEKVVYKKKMSIFDMDDTEVKVPPKLTLQVWDADLVSADDFLGSISLDLNRIPRPAKDAKKCKINMLKKDGSVPTLNLFKNKRCKGWWPFGAKDSDGARLVGKVEAEIHLLTIEEAEKSPAGLGREEPDSLPEPNRPDASFLWFMNPLKTLKYILWKNYKWVILKFFLLVIFIVFMGLFIYNVPGATVNAIFTTGK